MVEHERGASTDLIVKIAKEVINRTPPDVMENLRSRDDPKTAIIWHAFREIDDDTTGKIHTRNLVSRC